MGEKDEGTLNPTTPVFPEDGDLTKWLLLFEKTTILNEKTRTPLPPRKQTNGEVRENEDFLKSPKKNVKNLRVTIAEQPTSHVTTTAGDDVSLEQDSRGNWGGKMEFLFTCIGYAVGLGNVWRFPYLCYKNGGGAFLVPYILMLALVGLPLFFMELAFGQYASLGPITVWKINPLFKGLGMAMVSVSWLISLYYNVIIAHILLYLFASMRSVVDGLPWISCDNPWNTELCVEPSYAKETNATDSYNVTGLNVTVTPQIVTLGSNATSRNISLDLIKTPAEEYYDNYVLEVSSGIDEMGGVNWKLALCLLLAWGIVLGCLIRGVQSLGKVVYFTAIFPYVMLTIMFIRGVTLPGAVDGIIFYLKPDFSRLADARVWCDAATQIFYSLSACSGGLIAMASFNKFDNNCYKDAMIVSIINCATSVYAGFVVFSVLGFMAMEKGVGVEDVAKGGPGLVFVIYPEALSRMPVPWLWAILFFFMMATLGFGSQFSIVECVLSAITDEFHTHLRGGWQSIVFRTVAIAVCFLLGLPMVCKGGIYLLNLVDYSVSGFPLLFVGFFELIALMWIYGYHKFSDNIHMMLGIRPNYYWKICWMIVSPLVILANVVFNCIFYKPPQMDNYIYPGWAEGLGWMVALFSILLFPGVFIVSFCIRGGYATMKKAMKPTDEWGPSVALHERKDDNFQSSRTPLTPANFESGHSSQSPFLFPLGRTVKINSAQNSQQDLSNAGLNIEMVPSEGASGKSPPPSYVVTESALGDSQV